ncbi:hypothetical protein Taro_040993, partial [Colocasia esculenta]|nr:hypothetical protein [Colocasia esculenta]
MKSVVSTQDCQSVNTKGTSSEEIQEEKLVVSTQVPYVSTHPLFSRSRLRRKESVVSTHLCQGVDTGCFPESHSFRIQSSVSTQVNYVSTQVDALLSGVDTA